MASSRPPPPLGGELGELFVFTVQIHLLCRCFLHPWQSPVMRHFSTLQFGERHMWQNLLAKTIFFLSALVLRSLNFLQATSDLVKYPF